MAVVPAAQLIRGIYHENTSMIRRGAIGSVFGGSGLCLSSIAYVLSPDRKKEKD